MRFSALTDWLAWQESLHPSTIELGLERVAAVWHRLHPKPPAFLVITIGGTNGKGSSVAMLDSILRAAKYRTGVYTSPHLLRYNERIRLDGREIDDASLLESFARIDRARGDISLTYFEFGTLAALDIFARANVQVAILEVGLGGRLDAVNILAADVALVTTVDIDHSQWLGNSREEIAFEKAGIYRPNLPAIYGSAEVPTSLREHAASIGANLYCYGEDFGIHRVTTGWDWWGKIAGEEMFHHDLPLPALRGSSQLQNAAGILMVLTVLAEQLPVSTDDICAGLQAVRLAGRFQLQAGAVTHVLDVAHNPQAARELASNLAALPAGGRTLAVVGMLQDKDINTSLAALEGLIDHWYLASLQVLRGASAVQLAIALEAIAVPGEAITLCENVTSALTQARTGAQPGDRIVVFGSFYTVAEALVQPA
ncbi:MAG: bifunctional tetrahydrofolate synthase/dihydrofolate synthase [Thiohalomonadaceae bacterium]